MAFITLGNRQSAEDVVQEACCGLFRVWDRQPDGGAPAQVAVVSLNVLGVLAGHRFSPAGARLPQASGSQQLEYAPRTASQVPW